NPTTEADAGEGTDAEAEETTEAVEGPAGETSAEDGSGTEETSQAEETGADQNSEPAADETSEAGETVEGGTTDGAETEGSQAGEADETTGAAGNEAGETSGAAGSGEETTAADETTVEETGAQESQPETETETADNEADAEGEAPEEAGDADAADEAEAGAGEAQPEAGSATASISMRRLHQVASSVQVLDDADIVIDPEDVPGDETPEIREDSQVEVETGESTQAPEEEEPETTAEAETEEESEETREAETEETEPSETEETSAADSQETTGADAENGGTSAADESSAADDDTDATEESGDADIIIEETTPADGTDGTDTPVEVEPPAETTPAEEDNAGGSQAPEGNGDASEVPDFDEGQELEDDINGTLENLGDLNGKAYNTVTIWGSANARAYKVAAKDLEGVAAVEGTYSVSYTVDPVGTANVRGAKSIEEGQDLYFYVDPQVGYQITSVTANGAELETIDAAEVEASALAGHDYVYMVEAVEEDLEIVASLVEIEGMSHPEFNPDPVNRNGVIITVHAEEGIIPAGTELQVTEVTSQIGDAVKEKLENESDITVQEVIAYDINLVLDGRKLDNSWSENGYVDVSFSGSRIRRLTEEADTVSFYAADDDNRATMSARNAAQVTADNLKLEAVGETDVEDTSVSEVSFEAEHFTIYVGIFETQDTTVGDQISVDVAYVYENGTQAKPSQTVVIEKESGRDSYEFSVNVDAEEGYSIEIFEEETDSAVAYTVEGKTVKATLGSDIEQSHVTIKLVANEAGYKIVSHFPQLDGTEKTTEDDTCIGKVGKLTNVTAPEVPGFTAEEVRNQVVTADGNAVVHIQYARDEYTLVYNTQGGSYVKSKKGLYEQTVEVYAPGEPVFTCEIEAHTHTFTESRNRYGITQYKGGCYSRYWSTSPNCGKSEHTHGDKNSSCYTVTYTPQPARDGYDFAGWYKDAACTVPADTTVTFDQNFTPDADNKYQVTVYAKWEAHTVNYTIAYFRQVWDNKTNSGYYVYDGLRTGTAKVGETIDGDKVRGGYTLTKDPDYSEYSHADTATVKADGSTVVNVYYNLKKYTFIFDLGDRNTYYGKVTGTIKMDGKEYHGSEYKIENVVLGMDIADKWPTTDNTTRSNGDSLNTWNGNLKTKRFEVTTDMLSTTGSSKTYTADWTTNTTIRYVEYWLEKPDGSGYEKADKYCQSFITNGSLSAKKIYGFTYDHSNNTTSTYKFYYTRDKFNITYKYGSTTLKTDTNIRFGADISGNNYVPDRPVNVDADYTFGGWYDNAGFNGDPYSFTTMPAGNVVLYAKWEAPDRTVTVVFNNAETNEEIIIKKGDKLSSVKTPEKPGFDFAGWYTDESFADGSEFDINEPINTDTTIYAKWEEQKRADCVVRYVVKDSAAEGGYRDIMEPKEIKGALVGSVLLEEAVPYEDADGNKYAVNKAFQDYTVRNAGEGNEILFIYTAPSSLRYDVQYTYTDAEGKTTVVKEERDIAAGNAASFNVYRNPEIVKELNGLGYYVEERFVPVVLNAEEPNIVIFHLVIKPYTITYEGLGSITGWEAGSTGITNPNPGTYTLADSTITLINPVREGFTFNGWKLTAGEVREGEDHSPMAVTIEIAADGSKSKGDLAFRATWTESSYTVHYDTKGGTPTFVDMENVKWSQSGLLPATDPTRNGYTFAGWKYNTATVTSASRYSDLAGKDTVSEITLTAQWEIDTTKTVDIIYVTENEAKGTVSNPKDTIQIVSGQTLTGSVAQPTSGYMFAGWYKDGQMVYDKETLAPDQIRGHLNTNTSDGTYEATEFVAKFEKDPKETAIVTYVSENTDMGTVDPEANTIHIVDAEGLTGSTATAKEGYVCIGWYIGTDLITPNAELKPEDAKAKLKVENGRYTATTFTAKFAIDDENRVEVKYESESLKHGTVDNGLDSIRIVDADGLRGSTATAKPGYRFIGWYKGDTPTPISQNVKLEPDTAKAKLETSSTGRYAATTFTAKFVPDEKQTVKVTYTSSNPSGGSVTLSENNIQIVTADGLTGSSATVETGYRFAGWYKGDDRVSDNLVLSIDDAKAALNKSKDGETYAATEFVARFVLDENEKVAVTYVSDNEDWGTVGNQQGDRIQIITGENTLNGSSADAKAGYTFEGWYNGDERIDTATSTLTPAEAKTALNRSRDGKTYAATTFTAKFILDMDATTEVTYRPSSDAMGTVTNRDDTIQIRSAAGLEGSVASAKTGYQFLGWYKGEALVIEDENLTIDTAKANLNTNTENGTFDKTDFVARFEVDPTQTAAVTYESENTTMGSVGPETSNTIQAATGTLVVDGVVTEETVTGSTATAAPGYEFIGWFKNGHRFSENEILGSEEAKNNLDRDPVTGVYVDTTFQARFQLNDEDRVNVFYQTKDETTGTVTNDKGDRIQIVNAAGLNGSDANPKPGYKFAGWYKEETPVSGAENGTRLTQEVAKNFLNKKGNGTYDTTTFTAWFEVDENSTVEVTYESEDPHMGTVDHNKDTIQSVTGDGLNGSTAKANPGYRFVGWYKDGGEVSGIKNGTTLKAETAKNALEKNSDTNTYKPATFVARFELDDSQKVKVYYTVSDKDMGTVTVSQNEIQIVTGEVLTGSVAEAKAGYRFVGWYKGKDKIPDADDKNLDKSLAAAHLNKDTETDTYLTTTFTAKFELDETKTVDVFYKSSNPEWGTVTHEQDRVQIVTGEGLRGSEARAKAGYRFVGWYKGTDEIPNGKDKLLTPDKALENLTKNPADNTYDTTTFTAVFELDDTQKVLVSYKTESESKGTVTWEEDRIQVVTGEELKGSQAVAKPGYRFAGWFKGTGKVDNGNSAVLSPEAARKALDTNADGTYKATTFTATFEYDPEQRADVIYQSENPEYGSVNRDKDSVQALTGDPIYGSTATAKAGYKFIGWYKGNEPEPISEAAQFIPEKELLEKKTDGTYDTTTFTAKFELDKEQLVDVVYESEDISKGTVDNPGNKIQIVTAEGLNASTATKKAGYVFTGWFKGDQEITQENTLDVTKATAALDRNPDNTYKKTTFTAKFTLDASNTVPVTYESSNTAWGTVDNTGDNIQIVTADGLNGSAATALAGYEFVGWFKENADKSSSNQAVLSKEDAIKLLDTNPDGTYKATKFIARFQVDENQKTNVFYRSADETMGTVTHGQDQIQIRTAAGLNGSVAEARDGYRFIGWYKDNTEVPSTEGTLGPDAAKAALNTNQADGTFAETTFVAAFELDPGQTTTVTYESKAPAMGTVGPETSNTIQIATGDPVTGSTATPAAGYKFDGWYRNEDLITGNENLNAETAKRALNRDTEKGVYIATTFTAQFSIDDGQKVNVTYVSEDISMGSVDHNLDEIQIRTGDTLNGSSAKANPGYTFLGWYKGDEKISDSTKLEADVAKVNLNTENGTYDETEFTAKFAENEEVLLQYVSEDEKKGTVDPASEKVKPATGEAQGSVATAKPGYHFEKWTLKEQAGASLIQKAVRAVAGQDVSRDPMLTRDAIDQVAKDKDNLYMATTFQAHFAEDGPVTIQYQVAATDGAMGSVSKTSETLKPVSDHAAGSVAQPVTGYKLVSWTNEANQVVSTSETFVPARDADGLNFRQTYTAHFAPLDNLSYEVHYLYDGVEDHARADGKDGNAVFGTSIDFSRTETEFNGQNYIFEKTEGPTTVTEVSANNKLYVHYTLDVIGGEDPDPENPDPDRPRPDQIPDKYQIRFDYKSAGNGTVNGVLTEVHTIYEVLKDKETGEITATGKPMPAKPDADVAVKAAEGYAFDYWTTTENSDKDSSENMSAFAGKTYTKSTEFTAHFDTDKIGEKDPNQPDNIPDKYQITVTHKVVNGGWNDNREESEVVKVLTLKKGGQNAEDGTADYTGPEAGQKPAAGYKTGGWDVTSPRTFRKADDNHVYTYTYVKDSFKLTVRHEYEALDGTQTVDTIVNNVDTEFQTPLSYTTRMRENFVFAGVAVEGMTDTNTAQQIVEGTMPAQAVIITFHYQEDRIGNPENPEKPDGIPDKYQITFTYQAAANGTVTGTTTEVMTIQDITRDPATGTITAVGPVKAVSPTQPSVVTANEGYYFLNWSHGSDILADDKAVRAGSYTTSETFIANFKENPDNAWTAEKWVTNLPSRGYFRVGEDAHFIIEVTNTGNRPLKDVKIHETLKGAVISASTNGSYTLVNGDAVITELAVGRSVRVEATYKVTREDLFNREFRNIVVTSATIDREEPGAEPVDDVTADTGRIPAGAQGSGGSSGGGGGGSSSGTRSPGTGGGPTGGPGTVTIDPEAVPLANLPEMGNDDILALIDDEEVPLAALPKTGQA
ncbi:MAG: doubled motif LPXTG anchor domain-containing protein, partial [Lachnospiraceae bacterium]|nr:doubled motif LPXTG anchor domain-containing protein [Lachnospiraceae bacterium]